jgi:PST family polysaccharide transporter
MGITATGVAFLALYAVYLPVVWLLGRHYIGFAWTRAVKVQAVIAAAAALTVEIVARQSVIGGAAVSLLLGAALGIWATMQLSAQIGVGGQLGKLAAMADRVKRWTTARF